MTDLSDDLPGFLMFLRQSSTTSTALSAPVVLSDLHLGYDTEWTPGCTTIRTRIEMDAVPPPSAGALLVLLALIWS